jgi:hypothetical protein
MMDLRGITTKLIVIIGVNLLREPYIFYKDSKWTELGYLIRHKTPIGTLFHNEYHDNFCEILEESGMGDEETKNMAKEMELSFK